MLQASLTKEQQEGSRGLQSQCAASRNPRSWLCSSQCEGRIDTSLRTLKTMAIRVFLRRKGIISRLSNPINKVSSLLLGLFTLEKQLQRVQTNSFTSLRLDFLSTSSAPSLAFSSHLRRVTIVQSSFYLNPTTCQRSRQVSTASPARQKLLKVEMISCTGGSSQSQVQRACRGQLALARECSQIEHRIAILQSLSTGSGGRGWNCRRSYSRGAEERGRANRASSQAECWKGSRPLPLRIQSTLILSQMEAFSPVTLTQNPLQNSLINLLEDSRLVAREQAPPPVLQQHTRFLDRRNRVFAEMEGLTAERKREPLVLTLQMGRKQFLGDLAPALPPSFYELNLGGQEQAEEAEGEADSENQDFEIESEISDAEEEADGSKPTRVRSLNRQQFLAELAEDVSEGYLRLLGRQPEPRVLCELVARVYRAIKQSPDLQLNNLVEDSILQLDSQYRH